MRAAVHPVVVVALLCVALVVGAVAPVGAKSLDEIQQERKEAERLEAEAHERRQQAEDEEAEAQADVKEALAREAELRAERDDALARLAQLEQDFMEAVQAYEEARNELAEIEAELARLEASVKRLMAAVERREEKVGHLIRGLYKGGGQVGSYEAVLRTEAVAEAAVQFGYIRSAQDSQEEMINGLVADRRRLEGEQEKVDQARVEQEAVAAKLEERRLAVEEQLEAQEREVAGLEEVVASAEQELADLESVLANASAELASVRDDEKAAREKVAAAEKAEEDEKARIEEQKRIEEEKRKEREAKRREAANRSSGGGSTSTPGNIACPLGKPRWFMDTWGAARSAGRSHQGTDMFAPMGTPIYAYESGTVRLSSNTLGGVTLYLSGDSGNRYYYAHLKSYVSGLSSGQRVSTGEKIAYNGKSGNAKNTPAHLHIEVRPGGGAKANPYSYMKKACG